MGTISLDTRNQNEEDNFTSDWRGSQAWERIWILRNNEGLWGGRLLRGIYLTCSETGGQIICCIERRAELEKMVAHLRERKILVKIVRRKAYISVEHWHKCSTMIFVILYWCQCVMTHSLCFFVEQRLVEELHSNTLISVCNVFYKYTNTQWCDNGGICFANVDSPDTPRCRCPTNYSGDRCKIEKGKEIFFMKTFQFFLAPVLYKSHQM